MAIGVLLICIYYNIKIKGFGGWMHEMFTAPFGPKLAPANFILNIVEFCLKPYRTVCEELVICMQASWYSC